MKQKYNAAQNFKPPELVVNCSDQVVFNSQPSLLDILANIAYKFKRRAWRSYLRIRFYIEP